MSEGESLATLLGRLQVAGGVDLAAVVSIDGFLIEATHAEGLDAEEFAAWPADWLARIEYRERLAALGEAWDGTD
jgi:predicted regulator of Ras-like GTPase activity (Roadblock/LC7/MglB family)